MDSQTLASLVVKEAANYASNHPNLAFVLAMSALLCSGVALVIVVRQGVKFWRKKGKEGSELGLEIKPTMFAPEPIRGFHVEIGTNAEMLELRLRLASGEDRIIRRDE